MKLKSVKAIVPASTSNLGPAFDCLGLALGLYNELTLELHDGSGEPTIEIKGEGEHTLPRTRDNLLFRAANAVIAGRLNGRLVLKAVNRIPLARGLGSSAAAAVAGLFAANGLFEKPPLSREQLLQYAAALEGHPDNVAPAIFGGLIASVARLKAVDTYPLEAHKDLGAVVCVPEFELPTSRSRSVVPETYLREDAVANASRALLLGAALGRGQWDRLAVAMEDRFHQPYRAPLVPGFKAVVEAALGAGAAGAALSGAGPTVLALARKGAGLRKIGTAMEKAFAANGVKSRGMALEIDRKGIQIKVSPGEAGRDSAGRGSAGQ